MSSAFHSSGILSYFITLMMLCTAHDLQGHYTSLNKRGQQIIGHSSEELATLEFKDLATPEDVALAYGMLEKKLNGEATNTIYELSIKAKDGTIIPFEVNSQLIYENGKPVGVQGIARDIRARKEAEEQLRQVSESLLQAERRAITEYKFYSNVSLNLPKFLFQLDSWISFLMRCLNSQLFHFPATPWASHFMTTNMPN